MSIENINDRPLVDIQQEVKEAIERMVKQASHSVRGGVPDEMGNYSQERISDKERREILNEILSHNELLNLGEAELGSRFASYEDFLRELASQVQNYNEAVYLPICRFIEGQFDFKIDYADRNEVRFRNKVFVLMQMLTLSEEEIRERLGHGKLGDEKEEEIASELSLRFKREGFKK